MFEEGRLGDWRLRLEMRGGENHKKGDAVWARATAALQMPLILQSFASGERGREGESSK